MIRSGAVRFVQLARGPAVLRKSFALPLTSALTQPSASYYTTERKKSLAKIRPTSPHLTIYRLPYNANLSFMVRATGMGMTLGKNLFGLESIVHISAA